MLELIDARTEPTVVHIPRPRSVGKRIDPEAEARSIVEDVRLRGDEALLEHVERQTGVRLTPEGLRVEPDDIREARKLVRPALVDALEVMTEQLRATSERQLLRPWMDQRGDQMAGELVRPLRRIGIHVAGARAPGGMARASAVLMGAVPARVAGVDDVAVCAAPSSTGEVADTVLAACAVAGTTEVYRIDGAHAVAALAYGTQSVRPTEKIIGPGGPLVGAAKKSLGGWVGTDLDAWPTEIVIVADDTADPRVSAADLVAHAERGPLGSHVFITWVPGLLEDVVNALDLLVAGTRRAEDVENTLIEGGRAVLVRDVDQAFEVVNAFAPQHLQLVIAGALDYLDRVRTAGAVSVGSSSSTLDAGYVAGGNEMVPTGGASRWASPLGARDFMKVIHVSGLEPSALERLSPHARAMAEADGLGATATALDARVAAYRGNAG